MIPSGPVITVEHGSARAVENAFLAARAPKIPTVMSASHTLTNRRMEDAYAILTGQERTAQSIRDHVMIDAMAVLDRPSTTANIAFLMRSLNNMDRVNVMKHGQEMIARNTEDSVTQNVSITNAMVQALENVKLAWETASGIFMDTVYVKTSGQVLLALCI